MNNSSNTNNISKYLIYNTKSIKDYILLIRTNLSLFLSIFILIVSAVIVYAFLSKNIYKSTVTLRITAQKKSVLETPSLFPEVNNLVSDRFIANEIEIITNYDTREKYAEALIDSFYNTYNKNLFAVIKDEDGKGINGHKSITDLSNLLKEIISVDQMEGMDIIEISAESPSPYEASLI